MNVEIRDVKNKGKGIFATKDFKKGDHILNITGKIITTNNPSNYPEEITEHWSPISNDGYIFKFIHPESPWMYMNHSCEANAGVINNRKLIAKKEIAKGEEITVDYSAYDVEALTQGKKRLMMKCRCGSKNCRKIITTFDRLDKKNQEKLKRFLNRYLKKKYLGSKKN